jgi:hypothetical protein
MLKTKLIIICLLFLIIYFINKYTIGIKNLAFNDMMVDCYFILNFPFNHEQLLNVIDSYSFYVINNNNNNYKITVNNLNKKEILNITVINNNINHKLNIKFNHSYFDFNSLTKIINDYCENNIKKKNIKICKKIYYTDFLGINLLANLFTSNKTKTNCNKFIVFKKEIIEKKKSSNKYISSIDIIISKIINLYFLQKIHNNSVNILLSKKINNESYYIGNSITLHQFNIIKNDDITMAQDIRKSYKKPKIKYLTPIDIFITSWVPCNNNNYINTISTNSKCNNFPYPFLCFIGIINNNDYLITIIY